VVRPDPALRRFLALLGVGMASALVAALILAVNGRGIEAAGHEQRDGQ
jgi:hypothetical protein